MSVNRDANGFVVLDRWACLERLAQHRVAAVAITDHALPVVLPALYTVSGGSILIGAAGSGILGRRMPDSVVSMCVHDLDDDLLNGWTVTVTGLAELVTSLADLVAVSELRRWGSAEASQVVVRVSTEHISGRLISTT